jgi:hypothetical protein
MECRWQQQETIFPGVTNTRSVAFSSYHHALGCPASIDVLLIFWTKNKDHLHGPRINNCTVSCLLNHFFIEIVFQNTKYQSACTWQIKTVVHCHMSKKIVGYSRCNEQNELSSTASGYNLRITWCWGSDSNICLLYSSFSVQESVRLI